MPNTVDQIFSIGLRSGQGRGRAEERMRAAGQEVWVRTSAESPSNSAGSLLPPAPSRNSRRSFSQPLLVGVAQQERPPVLVGNVLRSRSHSPPPNLTPSGFANEPRSHSQPPELTPREAVGADVTMGSTLVSAVSSSAQLSGSAPHLLVPHIVPQAAGPTLGPTKSRAQSRGYSPGQHTASVPKSANPAPSAPASPKLTSRVTWTPASSPLMAHRVIPARCSLSPMPVRHATGPQQAAREIFGGPPRVVAGPPFRYVQYSVMRGVPGAAPNLSRPAPVGRPCAQTRPP